MRHRVGFSQFLSASKLSYIKSYRMQMTERCEKDEGVVDVDERPRDADDGQTAGRDDVHDDEATLQVVTDDNDDNDDDNDHNNCDDDNDNDDNDNNNDDKHNYDDDDNNYDDNNYDDDGYDNNDDNDDNNNDNDDDNDLVVSKRSVVATPYNYQRHRETPANRDLVRSQLY